MDYLKFMLIQKHLQKMVVNRKKLHYQMAQLMSNLEKKLQQKLGQVLFHCLKVYQIVDVLIYRKNYWINYLMKMEHYIHVQTNIQNRFMVYCVLIML